MSTVTVKPAATPIDVARIRRDFPVLSERIRNKELVYFDNGATTQKPLAVIYALQRYYASGNSNIHRGVHFLSQQATFAFARARGRIGQFINARENGELVFVRGINSIKTRKHYRRTGYSHMNLFYSTIF